MLIILAARSSARVLDMWSVNVVNISIASRDMKLTIMELVAQADAILVKISSITDVEIKNCWCLAKVLADLVLDHGAPMS